MHKLFICEKMGLWQHQGRYTVTVARSSSLKRNRRKIDGETYEYWSLVRTVRTAKGPGHKLVANLGKTPGLDSKTRRGWEEVVDLLSNVIDVANP